MQYKSGKWNPYIGPRPYETADKKLFFGRDCEINDLASLIVAHRVVLLYAPSGAGKTSLLNAGLIPQMEQERFEILPAARVRGLIPEGKDLEKITNPWIYNTLISWAKDKTDLQLLEHMSLSDFLQGGEHQLGNDGSPLPRLAIFDQFEELFTFYQERWEQREDFFNQVALALEKDPLLRVLFVMREEYLASLDPYMHLLPEKMRTRYRLDRLGRDAALLAIEGPLKDTACKFDKGVALTLADKLLATKVKVKDSSGIGKIVETKGEYVEPVQLQVVCQNLWSRLPENVSIISSEHIQIFGDVDQALTDFYEGIVQKAMKHAGIKQEKLRTWFNNHLITPGGTRGTVFQDKDFTGGISNKAVKVLEDEHLIRAEMKAGDCWFELTHDRLIDPILKSNGTWLNRRRKWRVAKRIGLVSGCLAILWLIVTSIYISHVKGDYNRRKRGLEVQHAIDVANERALKAEVEAKANKDAAQAQIDYEKKLANAKAQAEKKAKEREEYERTEMRIENLRKLPKDEREKRAETELNNMASYLWLKEDREKLIKILRDAKDVIPTSYGIDERAGSLMPYVDRWTDWPITIEYSRKRNINEDQLRYEWRYFATWMAYLWGIPLPLRLKLIQNQSIPEDEFHILLPEEGRKEIRKTFSFPTNPDYVVVSEKMVPSELQGFFNLEKSRWKQVEQLKFGGPWYWVPRWTLPLWTVVGGKPSTKEGAIAVAIANKLIDEPELVLTRECVEYLIRRFESNYPQSVAEAVEARGGLEGIRKDLIELVRQKQDFKNLLYIFDFLAKYPLAPPKQVTEDVTSDLSSPVEYFPLRLQGKRPGATEKKKGEITEKSREYWVYEEASRWLVSVKPQVRAYLGRGIVKYFIAGQYEYTPQIREILDDLKRTIYYQFGIIVPEVVFREDPKLADDAFRIEILNQTEKNEDARPIRVVPAQAIPRFIEEMRVRYVAMRTWWLTAESVKALRDKQSEYLRKWLEDHYTLTDLKLILRAVVAPSKAEVEYYEQRRDKDAFKLITSAQTLVDPSWLLHSLVFWTNLIDPMDLRQLARHLQETQRVSLSPIKKDLLSDEPTEGVKQGINELINGRMDNAAELFKKSIRLNRRSAYQAFLALYPRQSQLDLSEQLARLEKTYHLPAPGEVSNWGYPSIQVRHEIEDFLEHHGSQIETEQRRKLQLCLLGCYLKLGYQEKGESLLQELLSQRKKQRWNPDEEYITAYWMLERHKWRFSEPNNLSQIQELFLSAFKQFNDEKAEKAFDGLLSPFYKPTKRTAPIWHCSLLNALADLYHDNFWIPYWLGEYMASGDYSEKELKLALLLLGKAQANLSRVKPEDQARMRSWLDFKKATTLRNLSYYKDTQNRKPLLNQAFDLLMSLKARGETKKGWPGLESMYYDVAVVHLYSGNIDQATAEVENGLERFPESVSLQFLRFFLRLAVGQADEALKLAEDRLDKLAKADSIYGDWLLYTTMLQVLTGEGDFNYAARRYLNTSYDDRDCVRMMLYWALCKHHREDEAKDLLLERWQMIQSPGWSVRLEQGDKEVWGEMLIGYYAGKITREEIFGPLEDRETFEKSKLAMIGKSFLEIRIDYFYDALFQEVSGNSTDRKKRALESLEKVATAQQPTYLEYHMARYLIKQLQSEKGK